VSFALPATATSTASACGISFARRISQAKRSARFSATTTSIHAPGALRPPAVPRTMSSAFRPARTGSGAATAPARAASPASTSAIVRGAPAFPSGSRTSSTASTSESHARAPIARAVGAPVAAVRCRRPRRARRCIVTGTRPVAIAWALRRGRAAGRRTRPTSRLLSGSIRRRICRENAKIISES
jgi:hypothetical protein